MINLFFVELVANVKRFGFSIIRNYICDDVSSELYLIIFLKWNAKNEWHN